MVEFLFTEDNNSVDSEKQSSECFYDVSTSNMLNSITLHILFFLTYLATLSVLVPHWFLKFTTVH